MGFYEKANAVVVFLLSSAQFLLLQFKKPNRKIAHAHHHENYRSIRRINARNYLPSFSLPAAFKKYRCTYLYNTIYISEHIYVYIYVNKVYFILPRCMYECVCASTADGKLQCCIHKIASHNPLI